MPSMCLGCISGDEGVSEDWNSIVKMANQELEDGNSYNIEANEALENEDLEAALANIDGALDCYGRAYDDIDQLRENAGGEEFLLDYVDAWQGQVEEIMKGLDYLGIIINIDLFNKEFYEIASLHPTAQLQMTQAFNYYYGGDYDTAMTTAELSMNKYATIEDTSNGLIVIAQAIGEDYVITYVNGIKQLSVDATSCLEDLIDASQSALDGDGDGSQTSIDAANGHYEGYIETLDLLIGIESVHQNAFPSQGYALQDLRSAYLSMKENSESSAGFYADKMSEIEVGNAEFFE